MATADDAELVEEFERLYRDYYDDDIKELARGYPNERKSLYLDWSDLYRFDPDLAEDYRSQPEQLQEYAEEALRLYDLPIDVKLGQAHVRIRGLPETTDIRKIRSRHVNTLVSVSGIVRKATDVQPKIQQAAFECQRCGTLTHIPQSGGDFQEPHECQGCERQGPFQINFDQSEFVDAQKLRVQESPEGLRGGETPQALDVHIEDDITGEVTPGDHVSVTGVLRLEQQGNQQEKSPLFDVYMQGMTVEIDDEQFEDMEITDADKQEIVELSDQADIYEQMVGSIAPSIYGYDQEKLAMVLQLFSGVTKHLPDESRIRGDLHMLLIGDPGTGKCSSGDTRVALSDGTEKPIRELVESNLDDPKPVDDGVWDHADVELPSLTDDGTLERRTATKVWKREAPSELYRIRTASGTEIEVTPSHPLFVAEADSYRAVRADELTVGVHVAVASTAVEDASTPIGVAADGGGVVADRIMSIETVEPDDDWVYDLEVEGTHTYVSNGIVSHNSQLLSYVKNIAPRSVYTSGKGSSSAGLCVTGDTMVQTDDGFREIRDIVETDLPEPVTDETAVEKELRVATFDRATGETTDAVTSHAWRMPEKPCRRIETGHGKELEASVNTPVLTCGTDGIEWTPISEIEPGAYVAVPRFERSERSAVSVREFLELTTEKIDLADESVSLLRSALVDEFGTLRDAAGELGLSEDFVYDTLANRHVPQEKLDRILDAVDVCRSDLRYDRLMIRHGDSITVPERFDEDLLYLLGLVFGDGDISLDRRDGNRGMVRISNGDEELLERAGTIFEEKFGKRPEIERQDDRVPCIRVNSATIARLFSNAGMETPKQDLALAPRLTTARNADAFLRGLMDADGSVSVRDAGGSSVLLSTISETLSQQVQLMLETYGVRARTRERDRRGTYELADGRTIESKHVQHFVEIYGTDIDRYADAIGFETEQKRAALERVVGRTTRREEKIPVGAALATVGGTAGQYHRYLRRGNNPGRESARSMLDDLDLGETEPLVREAAEADLRWDEVVAVEDTGEKEVFDLTVPETHNFVGNGVVTHNTAAAVRDDFGEGQQWTLEAGALVLADQGVAAVDELDKMRCVTGDTLVHLGDGRIDRIREVAAEAAGDGTVEPLPNGRTIRDVDLDIWTMTDDGAVVTRPVTAIHEYEAPESLTEVELASGERLTATDDHPFFVLADGERVERPAAELCDGDWVYVPRRIPDRATDGGAAATAPDATPQTDDAIAMAAVLGYLAGDGNLYEDREEGVYSIRFTNKEDQLLSHFETVCRRAFDGEPTRPPSEQRDDGVETVRLHGREYADAVVGAGMNLETYDGKRLPRAVTTASSEAKAAFLRALADSEGNVESRAVKIHSSSHELLLGAKQLLLEFGVSCQIQHDERADGRDLYVLAITDADSLRRFERQVGFTLDRKRRALDDACETVDGDRTILDVIPDCGDLLEQLRTSLRLHQTECGIGDATYCNFENGDANVSIHRAERILDAFETRRERAQSDRDRLRSEDALSWERLDALKARYHVSQSELATGTGYSQQEVSRLWSDDDLLAECVRERLLDVVSDVAETDLTPLRQLVAGDVKWRQVSAVRETDPADPGDERALLRRELADVVGCPRSEAVERARSLLDRTPRIDDWDALKSTLDRYGVSQTDLADDVGVHQTTVSRWISGTVDTDRFDEVRDAALDRVETVRERIRDLLEAVEKRSESAVYDLTVEGTHNFLANGMVVHNSEDRSAMHQALEQQEISISKAGINATLKSRCSLLGAANPKYGRFDQYEPIGEQIDLEPALISRFDLIFTVTDEPDEEEDRNLAEHILTTNYAGELNTQHEQMASPDVTREEVDDAVEQVDPEIDAELLRKYVAYAKQNCHPRMTEEAREAIREFYVDLRSKGLEEDAPVPVTARQLEALVRLAEASARVRLSDTVSENDAERVIEIVRSCLQDIGVDPETGQFDADVVETGTSKSQRDRIRNLKELIGEIEEEYEEGAPVDVVMERADEIGMDASKAEHEIEKLKQKGEVYEPATDHLRTT